MSASGRVAKREVATKQLRLVCLNAGFTGLNRFDSAPKDAHYASYQSVKDVEENNRQQDVARIEKDEHADGDSENDRAHAPTASPHSFET